MLVREAVVVQLPGLVELLHGPAAREERFLNIVTVHGWPNPLHLRNVRNWILDQDLVLRWENWAANDVVWDVDQHRRPQLNLPPLNKLLVVLCVDLAHVVANVQHCGVPAHRIRPVA